MSAKIDQKTYLQKYLGGSKDKKKKKKKPIKGEGLKIIDDDLDLTKLRPLDGEELDILGEGEDAPQIAGIIDERPEELRNLEQFKTTSKWRVINQDDGFNSSLKVEEIKNTVTEVAEENTLIFGKMYSDSENEENGSDLSPPRKVSKSENLNKASIERKNDRIAQNKSDDDLNPPRQKESNYQAKQTIQRDRKKPSRWSDNISEDTKEESKSKSRHRSSSSDLSPPRKSKKSRVSSSDVSPPRRKREKSPRKYKDFDTQHSKSYKNYSNTIRNEGNKRGDKRNSDSDLSPLRKSRRNEPKREKSDSPLKHSKVHKSQTNDSGSDLSPPRKNKPKYPDKYRTSDSHISRKREKSISPPRRNNLKTQKRDSDSDISPRKNKPKYPEKYKTSDNHISMKRDKSNSPPRRNDHKKQKHDSDSDLSPPRKNTTKNEHRKICDSPPPTNKKMAKTLEGKKAGLQNARQLQEENDSFKRREESVYRNMTDEVSGRNAQVVSRRTGKRETSEDRRKERQKAEKQKELDEKYKKWGKGLKQVEDQEKRVRDYIEEANKPFARHKDDSTLEGNLKAIEREGDPMLEYMRERNKKGRNTPERPTYKGNYPPNRFNIRPGYRWDGVDRSNGYEQKLFQHQNMRKAQQEEAFKWSTEDL